VKLRLESLGIGSGSSAVGMNATSRQPHPETEDLVGSLRFENKNRSSLLVPRFKLETDDRTAVRDFI